MEDLKSAKARRLRVEMEQKIENEREESTRQIAHQTAKYGASGVTLQGSPTIVLGAMAAQSMKRVAQLRALYEARIAEAEEELERETTRAAQFSIANSQNIQIGDFNVQDLRTSVGGLVLAIDSSDGTAEQKAEAKSRLEKLLEHPLVAAIVGAAVGGLLGQSGK